VPFFQTGTYLKVRDSVLTHDYDGYLIAADKVTFEKKEKEWDDIIIMNNEGYVSEGLQSNIFFVKNKFFLTPALETGCIEGIMRNFTLEILNAGKVRTGEVNFELEDLMEAEQVFLCNASGIRFIKEIEGKKFNTKIPSALVEVFKHYDQKH